MCYFLYFIAAGAAAEVIEEPKIAHQGGMLQFSIF